MSVYKDYNEWIIELNDKAKDTKDIEKYLILIQIAYWPYVAIMLIDMQSINPIIGVIIFLIALFNLPIATITTFNITREIAKLKIYYAGERQSKLGDYYER